MRGSCDQADLHVLPICGACFHMDPWYERTEGAEEEVHTLCPSSPAPVGPGGLFGLAGL